MKKLIFTLLALVGTMSINAQIIKVMKGEEVVATFTAEKADKVVFEKMPEPPEGSIGTEKRNGDTEGSMVDVNWVQLWENGPKFAEYNVGATSENEYGGYYCWGMAINKDPKGAYWRDDDIGDHDTATNLWGNNWRLPTSAELYTLLNKCTMEWIDGEEKKYKNTNAKGYLFTGKDAFISNKVFLPTAGDCVFGYASGQGMHGDYWSSTYYSSTTSCFLYFDMNRLTVTTEDREYGFSVRAVLNENK